MDHKTPPSKYSFRITPEMDFDTQTLKFTTEIDGFTKQITRESVCFKEKVVRETLIALGWTPPTEACNAELEAFLKKRKEVNEEIDRRCGFTT